MGRQQRVAYRAKLRSGLLVLGNNPRIGIAIDEIAIGLRALRVEHHNFYHRIDLDHNVVIVLRILHERADAALQVLQ